MIFVGITQLGQFLQWSLMLSAKSYGYFYYSFLSSEFFCRNLKINSLQDIKWKWENFSASKGDSGWYLQKSYSKVSNLISRNSESPIVPITAYENKDFENFIETNVWTKLLIEMTRYEKIRTQSLAQLESIHLLRFATVLSQCLMRIIQSGSLSNKKL